jgi:hypothetical protein
MDLFRGVSSLHQEVDVLQYIPQNVQYRRKVPKFFGDIPITLSVLHTASTSCKKRPGEGRDIE